MELHFPEGFIWGTSTAAYQIETAFDHTWKGQIARSGEKFLRTTDHELRREEDTKIICSTGNSYRCSLDWSKLQRSPYGDFNPETVEEYKQFLQGLKNNGITIMLVLHHFAEPNWFAARGGWTGKEAESLFLDYTRKMIQHFGKFADYWNTFNEPGGYLMLGFLLGMFPPHRKSLPATIRVLNTMVGAHIKAARMIREKNPGIPIGISKHTMLYEAESNAGKISQWLINRYYIDHIAAKFNEESDFTGLSYYGRVPLKPTPISEIDTPGKLKESGVRHDKMWQYYPQGISKIIRNYYNKFGKPLIITENGLCTDDDTFRIESIQDYLSSIHECIQDGVDIRGYYHWTTWDNFEWFLGPSFRFGLYSVNFQTMERTRRPSADFYYSICKSNLLSK